MSKVKPLYELQQIDFRLLEIEVTLAQLDDGSGLRQEVERREEQIKQLQEKLRALHREQRDRELELGSVEEKMRQLQQRSASGQVRSPREQARLHEEVEALRHQQDGLQDRILLMMDEAEGLEKQLREEEQALAEAKQRLAEVQKQYEEATARLATEREQLQQDRRLRVEGIESDLLQRYDLIKQRSGNVAVVKVEDDMCMGCRVTLTTDARRQLRNPEAIPLCLNCGRILYVEEEPSDELMTNEPN